MRYEFSQIEICGVVLPVEGYAEFSDDPRNKRWMPDIYLCGYAPGPGVVSTDLAISTTGTNAARWHLLMAMHYALRDWLKETHFKAICDQWDEEASERRIAAQGAAREERFS